MAPKRSMPLDEPPSASSDDTRQENPIEDDEQSSGEEEESNPKNPAAESGSEGSEEDEKEEEEEQEEETSQKKKPKPNATTIQIPHSESEAESDEGSDSEETRNSPTASAFTVKPIASKPMVGDPSKPKKPSLKLPAAPAAPAVKAPGKRAAELEKNGKDSRRKKSKVSNGDVEDGEKKSASSASRVWSEDDEIVVLQGILDYQSTKGTIPTNAEMESFQSFIKDSIHVDATKTQLSDKIRRLKKKYLINAEKGDRPVFPRSHDRKSFELSRKIWGSAAPASVVVDDSVCKSDVNIGKKGGAKVNSNSLADPKEEAKAMVSTEVMKGDDEMMVKAEDFATMYPHLNEALMSEYFPFSKLSGVARITMKKGLSFNGDVQLKEMEEKWEAFQEEELKFHLKRLELHHELTELVLKGIKSSKS